MSTHYLSSQRIARLHTIIKEKEVTLGVYSASQAAHCDHHTLTVKLSSWTLKVTKTVDINVSGIIYLPIDVIPLHQVSLNKVSFVPNNGSLLGIIDKVTPDFRTRVGSWKYPPRIHIFTVISIRQMTRGHMDDDSKLKERRCGTAEGNDSGGWVTTPKRCDSLTFARPYQNRGQRP